MFNMEGEALKLTSLDKVMWPEGLTKAHLIDYYYRIAPFLLPYLYHRPLVLKRYPEGIAGEAFYQKECPEFAPAWVKTHPVGHTRKTVRYIVCNDTRTLLWIVNLNTIEPHAWLARTENLESPDLAVIDLDPPDVTAFRDTLAVARLARGVLAQFGLTAYPKTSGAAGLHLFIPLAPVYAWADVTAAMKFVAETVAAAYPERATVERKVEKRAERVYLDYLQNGRGKTMAFPYGLRPLPGAPVSTPLDWREVEAGEFQPRDFNLRTIFPRLQKMGDIYRGVLQQRQTLDKLLAVLK